MLRSTTAEESRNYRFSNVIKRASKTSHPLVDEDIIWTTYCFCVLALQEQNNSADAAASNDDDHEGLTLGQLHGLE